MSLLSLARAQLLAEFDGLFAPQRARLRAASEDGASIPAGVPAIDMNDGKSAMTALKICVHCADISNPCKPWDIYTKVGFFYACTVTCHVNPAHNLTRPYHILFS